MARFGESLVRLAGAGLLLCLGATPAVAQDIDDLDAAFYAYLRESDPNSILLLGELTAETPEVADAVVSPDNIDEIFAGNTTFTNYDFAANLPATFIDRIDEADEYMVFAGDFVGPTGAMPAYVAILTVSTKVFIIQGFVANADDLFELAAITIAEGMAPESFKDYTRVDTPADAATPGPATPVASPQASPVAQQGNDGPRIFCHVDANLAVADLDGDGLITIEELSTFSGVEGVDTLIASMVQSGLDAVQYADC
jgi:hypothetical protein